MKTSAWFFIGTLLLAVSVHAQQGNQGQVQELVLINQDPKDVGLNDPTKAKPTGGNPGTTVGEQRRIAYQFAMDLWSAVLRSPVTVHVEASFAPLTCDSLTNNVDGKDVLGHAYANDRITTKHGLPRVLYQYALANAIDGQDLAPLANEIHSEFNGVMGGKNPDKSDCMPDQAWYYGLDGKTPAKHTNFINIVMHEIGHGLGFAGDPDFGGDIYSHFVYDNRSSHSWEALDYFRRLVAKIDQNVVFRGPHVHAELPLVLGPKFVVRLTGSIQHDVQRYGTAAFGPAIAPGVFMSHLVIVNDGAGDDPADACEPLAPGSLIGRVAFINRGTCDFEAKARNAQDAGAIAVIIGNVATSNKPEETAVMALSKDLLNRATIPAVQLILTDANVIRNAPVGDITAQTLNVINGYEGTDDNGDPYLYAPPIFDRGSSFSHFDSLASPDLLMERSDSPQLAAHINLDLTPAVLADEGWKLNAGNGMIGSCDTGVRAVVPGGKIIGANVQAYARTCLAAAQGSRSKYLRCMTDHASDLKNAKLIDSAQLAQIRTCAAQVEP